MKRTLLIMGLVLLTGTFFLTRAQSLRQDRALKHCTFLTEKDLPPTPPAPPPPPPIRDMAPPTPPPPPPAPPAKDGYGS